MPKKKSWFWKHRVGIRKAGTYAGLFGGGALGLGVALTVPFAGAGTLFVFGGSGAGTLGGSALSRKISGHFRPKKAKSAFQVSHKSAFKVATKSAFKSPLQIKKPKGAFQIG